MWKSAHFDMKRGVACIAFLVIITISQNASMLVRLKEWISDTHHYLLAKELYFADTVVLDIDDESLAKLRPLAGNWPFSRDVYANVMAYLHAAGARQVVFDILFIESRDGDSDFGAALNTGLPAILVAGTTASQFDPASVPLNDSGQGTWSVPGPVPTIALDNLLLPTADIVDHAEMSSVRIGVISASSDPDGVIRKLGMLYRYRDSVLPSVALSAAVGIQDQYQVQCDADCNAFRVGDLAVPVDAAGFAYPRFPRNLNSVLSMPFHVVAEAALNGDPVTQDVNKALAGKTVFIGSTAYLSDRVNTPGGAMSGTYLLATVQELLKHGLIWTSESPLINYSLALIAALPILLFTVMVFDTLRVNLLVHGFTLCAALILGHVLLSQYEQLVDIALPVQIGLLSMLMHGIYGYHHQGVVRAELQHSNEELMSIVDYDQLTGLKNRRALLDSYATELDRVKRSGGEMPAIAILDLDHFKQVNDTYGHQAGDEALKVFSNLLLANVRSVDTAARWGGEEFVVLMPSTHCADASTVLDRIRDRFQYCDIPCEGSTFRVTMSAGITRVTLADRRIEDAIERADQALYDAKHAGRNRLVTA